MKAAIPRTATFAWSPYELTSEVHPYLATGTVAGALDESFSNESTLELWQPHADQQPSSKNNALAPLASLSSSARFNRLAWGNVSSSRPKGVLAAGLENGELALWDPVKILDGGVAQGTGEEASIMRNTTHTGPVRGLEYNRIQNNLIASGASNGEIFIWDLNSPGRPYSPSAQRSPKVDDVTALAWNNQVPHILATSSNTGFIVVWDLKKRSEFVSFSYSGGAANAAPGGPTMGGGGPGGSNGSSAAFASGGRRGMSAICWHPDNATRLVTASEDDSSPIVMVWDLRNARAPEKIMTGHDRGILSLSWCRQDSDLLASTGKDNRTILWNPNTGERVGEVGHSENWNFDVQWCPRNPSMLATASFDGKIKIHGLQNTGPEDDVAAAPAIATQLADGADLFNLPAGSLDTGAAGDATFTPHALSLTQPPKWLKRPVTASFGFGGQLVSTSRIQPAPAAPQGGAAPASSQAMAAASSTSSSSATVKIRNVVTEPAFVERANRLQDALASGSLADFCEERAQDLARGGGSSASSSSDEAASWKALTTLFSEKEAGRVDLLALLGFSKDDIQKKVEGAIAAFKKDTGLATPTPLTQKESGGTAEEAVQAAAAAAAADVDAVAPADTDTSATPSITEESAESTEPTETDTQPDLFGSEEASNANGSISLTTSTSAADDFFASGPPASLSAIPDRLTKGGASIAGSDAGFPSAAATIGSAGPGSVVSESGFKATTFKIYPSEEAEVDKLLTRALVLGDFESAVSLCVSTERFADALLLAVQAQARGQSSDLLERTQAAYFEKRTAELPYLRLFQSIVSNDLADIVQNADLGDWQEIFVVLCTFAKAEEFSGLAEQLGQRLEFHYASSSSSNSSSNGGSASVKAARKNAVLCYLAAGKLEKVATLWIDEMKEQEAALRSSATSSDEEGDVNYLTAHAEALETFVEKITVFQHAVGYVDVDLQTPTQNSVVAESGTRTYKLAQLYDRILEYVNLLAGQGLIGAALSFVEQTPSDYRPSAAGVEVETAGGAKERLLEAAKAAGANVSAVRSAAAPANAASAPVVASSSSSSNPYGASYASTSAYGAPAPSGTSGLYGASNATYGAPAAHQQTQQQAPASAFTPAYPSEPYNPYGATPYGATGGSAYGAPPYGAAQSSADQTPPPPPAPPVKRDTGGWNDVPTGMTPRRTGSAMGGGGAAAPGAAAKVAPIMSPFPNAPAMPSYGGGPNGALPPPPRGATPGARGGYAGPPPPGQGGGGGAGAYGPPPGGRGPPPPSGMGMGQGQMQQGGQPLPPPPMGGARGQQPLPPPPGPGQGGPAPGGMMRGPPGAGPGQGYGGPPPPGPARMGSGAYGAPPGGVRPGSVGPGQQGQGGYGAPPGGVRPGSVGPGQQQGGPPRGPQQAAAPNPYGPPPGQQQQQQQGPPQGQFGQPGGIPRPPSTPLGGMGPPGRGPPGVLSPPGMPARGTTPGPPGGAGAGAPPRSQTPAKPSSKYPPGDRSHIPDSQKLIFEILSREFSRVRQTTPPAQKRMVDETERKLNLLFDGLNCGTIDPKAIGLLIQLAQAVGARNQQGALGLHLELATSSSGELSTALTGIKFLISRLNA
ncbi:unnamed protein product [Tilletia controversa]|nr:unnamed protein product [Tilletia controversa]